MSPQADYVVSNGTGAAVRSDINGQLAAIVSNNSGASAPTPTYAYMLWADTSTNLLKLRNGANSAFITVGDLTAANLGLATLASPTFTGTATIPTLTVSTAANIPLGSAASPTLYFTGDSNTGLYSPGADQVALSTGGTGRLFINSSGSVGIGTSSPGVRLQVQDSIAGGSDGTVATLHNFSDTGGDTRYVGLNFRIGSDNGTSAIRAARTSSAVDYRTELSFWTNPVGSTQTPVRAMTIDHLQRVGIGSASDPGGMGARLWIDSTTDSYFTVNTTGSGSVSGINFRNSNGNGEARFVNNTGGPLTFYRSVVNEAARIDSSGRLLVGTSSSRGAYAGNLEIEATSTAATIAVTRNSNDTSPSYIFLAKSRSTSVGGNAIVNSGDTLGYIGFLGSDGTSPKLAASITSEVDATPGTNDMPGRLVFSTTADGASSPTERMRITNAGALSYSPCSGSDLVGNEACGFIGDGTYAPIYKVKTALTSTKYAARFYNGNGEVGNITMNGSATAYNTSSDYRLKENVVAVVDGITRLQQLKPSRFNFKADPTNTVDGFIAHEVQAVVPEAVTGEKDAVDSDGNPKYQGIDQSKLVPLLTAALQEAIGEIESLKARVAALESA